MIWKWFSSSAIFEVCHCAYNFQECFSFLLFAVLHPFLSRLIVLFVHLDPSVYIVDCYQVSGDPWLSVRISKWRTLDKYLWLWQIPLPLFKSVSPTDLTLERGGWTGSAYRACVWRAAGWQASRSPHDCQRKEGSTSREKHCGVFYSWEELISQLMHIHQGRAELTDIASLLLALTPGLRTSLSRRSS